MENLEYIIIAIAFILFLYINRLYYEKTIKEEKEKNKKEIAELNKVISQLSTKPLGNFESDMNFLLHVISDTMANFKMYTLKPRDVAGYKVIDDELFEIWRERIITDVVSQLSPNYRKILQTYYTEEGLMRFIIEKVNFEMIEMIIVMKFTRQN